jgi:hypothetical protein
MDIIARENEPHGNGDMAVLRDDELGAVAGGVADLQTERMIFGALKTIGGKAKIPDGRFST